MKTIFRKTMYLILSGVAHWYYCTTVKQIKVKHAVWVDGWYSCRYSLYTKWGKHQHFFDSLADKFYEDDDA